MVIFQMSWSVLVVCLKLRSSCMRLRSELPSGKCPRHLFLCLTALFSWAVLKPETGFWRLLVELFLWKGSLPPSQGRVLP